MPRGIRTTEHTLSPDDRAEFASMYVAGAKRTAWYTRFPGVSEGVFRGLITRMHLHRPPDPGRVRGLSERHPASIEGRTLFPDKVRDVEEARTVLQPGAHSAKLGSVVSKGPWRGMPIFSLTLEERATCPRSCAVWDKCYGNSMPFAWRNRHGPELEARLGYELRMLQERHPGGYVVRAHILGDWYSAAYVKLWRGWLRQFPALHVFGFTALTASDYIGQQVRGLTQNQWDRFAIRYSTRAPGYQHAITLADVDDVDLCTTLICPAQTGRTATCSTCGLCWSPAARHKTIAFILHGPKARGPA